MKKILLLGGSAQQIVAIETAKRLGYYTILCDYLIDNPGQQYADKFYLVSTTDKEAVLEVARKENIDGILAYASDPAAPTAAYVAEKMGLPTSPFESVDTLCNKDKFRDFLQKNSFHTPKVKKFNYNENVKIDDFCLPIIVKPVDSSGSKGITMLYDLAGLENAIDYAFESSRGKRIVIEEFIEKNHNYLIGGDVYIVNGKIMLWGLLNCHRDDRVNKLVPVGKSYPLDLDSSDIDKVKETIQKLVDLLQIQNGAMNVELIIDKKGNVYPIDIGPRNGGNMIPDLLGLIFKIDLVEMTIKVTMGENVVENICSNDVYYATHNLHSSQEGMFKDIYFSEKINKHIVRKVIYKKSGDMVQYFDNASKAIGIIFLKFDSKNQMDDILLDIYNHVQIIIE